TVDNVSFTGNVGATPTYNALPSPAGLTVTPGTGTGLALSWGAVAGATGYAIERSIDGASFTQIGTTTAAVTSYNDNNLFGVMRYFYRVSAIDRTGNSAPSDIISPVNRPDDPT